MSRIAALFITATCLAPVLAQPSPWDLPPPRQAEPAGIRLNGPQPDPNQPVLPINLATALGLAGSRPIDVQLAAERIRRADAALQQARATWLPTVTIGGDYNRHDGEIQNADGTVTKTSRSSVMFGAGSGIGTAAVFTLNDAVFGPLAARQAIRVRQAELQSATNDSMLTVTDAYFTVEQARGELAGAVEATRRAAELQRRVEKLAAGLVPALELSRVQTEVERRVEAELSARERWQLASADLVRVLRLEATSQVEPLEPPHLQVTMIDLNQSVDDLVVVGLTNRPELAANRAQVDYTLTLLRQEKLRPLMPSLLLRGWSTPVTGTLGIGAFAGGQNGSLGSYALRSDYDVQLLWQLDNLGFGNVARIRGRQSDYRAATLELFRIQDRVASDVARAYAQARLSAHRANVAEREVRWAVDSYDKNLIGLGETRRFGDIVQTVVRPQEVLAAVQALAQAYTNYYAAVADSNRAQFRLFWALGQPAHLLNDRGQCFPPVQECQPAQPPLPALPARP